MGFPRQEYWSGLPSFPSPGDLPHPGAKPTSPALAGGFFFFFFNTEPPWKPSPKYTSLIFQIQKKQCLLEVLAFLYVNTFWSKAQFTYTA